MRPSAARPNWIVVGPFLALVISAIPLWFYRAERAGLQLWWAFPLLGFVVLCALFAVLVNGTASRKAVASVQVIRDENPAATVYPLLRTPEFTTAMETLGDYSGGQTETYAAIMIDENALVFRDAVGTFRPPIPVPTGSLRSVAVNEVRTRFRVLRAIQLTVTSNDKPVTIPLPLMEGSTWYGALPLDDAAFAALLALLQAMVAEPSSPSSNALSVD